MAAKRRWITKAGVILALCGCLLFALGPMVMYYHSKHTELRHRQNAHMKAAERLEKATTDLERFLPLTELANSALYLGFTNDARGYAEWLLKIAPQFQEHWNYGNAIHDGNEVLGRIAMRQGRLQDAKRFLIEAGKSPGSPQLEGFGPDMRLAQDLLKRGERETVLEYLKLCRRFWKLGGGRLEEWIAALEAGKTPNLQNKYPL